MLYVIFIEIFDFKGKLRAILGKTFVQRNPRKTYSFWRGSYVYLILYMKAAMLVGDICL